MRKEDGAAKRQEDVADGCCRCHGHGQRRDGGMSNARKLSPPTMPIDNPAFKVNRRKHQLTGVQMDCGYR